MVYMTPEELGWRPFVKTWIPKTYPDEEILSAKLKTYLHDLFEVSVDIVIDKMRNHLYEPIPTVNIQLVVSICNFIQIFFTPEYGMKGNDEEKKKLMLTLYIWCFAWGMGASVDERSKERLDDFIKDAFKRYQFPSQFTIFDYFFDKKDMSFKAWTTKVPAFEYVKDTPYFELLVPTVDTYRHSYCLELLLENEKPAFFTGSTGVGKSVIIQNLLTYLQDEKDFVPIILNFSAQTSSKRTQLTIEERLEKKRRTLFGAGPGKKIAIFVDDINMPATEVFGAQPPIELLRLFIDKKGFYDRDELIWKDVEDTTLICASAPPGGGRNPLSLRFTRHFNMFCVPDPSKAVLTKIFGSIISGFFIKNNFID
jgi:dynein heavy chain